MSANVRREKNKMTVKANGMSVKCYDLTIHLAMKANSMSVRWADLSRNGSQQEECGMD